MTQVYARGYSVRCLVPIHCGMLASQSIRFARLYSTHSSSPTTMWDGMPRHSCISIFIKGTVIFLVTMSSFRIENRHCCIPLSRLFVSPTFAVRKLRSLWRKKPRNRSALRRGSRGAALFVAIFTDYLSWITSARRSAICHKTPAGSTTQAIRSPHGCIAGGFGGDTPKRLGRSSDSICDHHASRSSTISCIMQLPAQSS